MKSEYLVGSNIAYDLFVDFRGIIVSVCREKKRRVDVSLLLALTGSLRRLIPHFYF